MNSVHFPILSDRRLSASPTLRISPRLFNAFQSDLPNLRAGIFGTRLQAMAYLPSGELARRVESTISTAATSLLLKSNRIQTS